MSKTKSSRQPDADEYLKHALGVGFQQACAAVRQHGTVHETVHGYRFPRQRAIVTIDAEKWRGGVRASPDAVRLTLWAWRADCAVYMHEAEDPRVPGGGGRGRLVVAVAVWPRQGLSALRVASYGEDGSLEETDADLLALRASLLEVPWLPAAGTGGRVPPERGKLIRRAVGSLIVFTALLGFLLAPAPPRLWEGPAVAYAMGAQWTTGSTHRTERFSADADDVGKAADAKRVFTGRAWAQGKWAYSRLHPSQIIFEFAFLSLPLVSRTLFLHFAVAAVRGRRRE
ncbi:hypothetical protein [Streptomyces abikoensis]